MPSSQNQATANRSPLLLPLTALIIIIGALFVWQLHHFSPFITDDAYISLRYSQRLLEGHGLTWNDGHRVEGYTNLLWVLLCALLAEFHLPLPLAAHVLGIATNLLVLVAITLYIYRHYPTDLRFFSALIACSALVLSSPFSVWALGGLEQPLLACFLVWAAYFMLAWIETPNPSTSQALVIGTLLGFACLSRADASIFTAAFFVASVITDGLCVKSVLSRARILPVPILFFTGQEVFRKLYYHEWLPNTAYVKVAFTSHRIHTGLRYLYIGCKMNAVFLVLLLIASYALLRSNRRKPVVFVWCVAVIWTMYLVIIGGDIFPAVRHFEPVIALFGFLIPGCTYLAQNSERRLRVPVMGIILVLTALISTSDAMTEQEHWEMQGQSLGIFLDQAFGPQKPLLASDAAGVVPFFAHLPSLDPLGLNDYHIAHEASRAKGHGWVGHELGDGKYILDQKPDLLLFSSFDGQSSLFPADEQIVNDPRFSQYYQPIRVDTPAPNSIRALLYLRRLDGKIGITSKENAVLVPAYLADANAANSVRLAHGEVNLILPPHGSATFDRIPVPAGTWQFSFRTGTPDAFLVSSLNGAERAPGCDVCILERQGSTVAFTISNSSNASSAVHEIALLRR